MSDHPHEIFIIKRHHGGHDDHHGGAWKIAFADFMTAMMAFFLVMWLISANDKTRASVARYFNPVRLVDATTQPRGLHDSKTDSPPVVSTSNSKETESKEPPKPSGASKPAGDKKTETPGGRDERLDSALRDSPFAALAEIAGKKGPGEVTTPVTNPPPAAIGRRGGDAFRDPFAPPPPSTNIEMDPVDVAKTDIGKADAAKMALAKADADTDDGAANAADGQAKALARKAETEKAEKQRQDDLKAQLVASMKTAGREAGPGVDVRATPGGLIVSLTDTDAFSMFSNGSAVPSRKVVLLMDRVAQVLKTRPGEIVVRGYTDNKQFHTNRYDNWHLSLDRAQVTHYMLVRGGVADARIDHVEGYADRVTKAGVDPSSPLNRRIEILLKDKA